MNLKRPLVIIDLETTGTWIEKDRIIEIAMIRCEPDGSQSVYEKRIQPGMRVPKRVSEITGITDKDLKGAPYFRQVATEIFDFLQNADLAGFNLERFDLPLLTREFNDAGIEFTFNNQTVYDAQKIYHLHERRDLTAAYAFYCHKDLADAHSALADAQATREVLDAQVKKYGKDTGQIEDLKGFQYKSYGDFYDADRKFRWWNGELYMMFGKYARREPLRKVAEKDRGYLQWILSQNFSDQVKELVEGALEGKFPVYEGEEDS